MFHDYRRTAATNLIRAGVPEPIARQITGHKTRSMFDRYNIHEDRDIRLAIQARAAWEAEERQRELERLPVEELERMPTVSAGVQ